MCPSPHGLPGAVAALGPSCAFSLLAEGTRHTPATSLRPTHDVWLLSWGLGWAGSVQWTGWLCPPITCWNPHPKVIVSGGGDFGSELGHEGAAQVGSVSLYNGKVAACSPKRPLARPQPCWPLTLSARRQN